MMSWMIIMVLGLWVLWVLMMQVLVATRAVMVGSEDIGTSMSNSIDLSTRCSAVLEYLALYKLYILWNK